MTTDNYNLPIFDPPPMRNGSFHVLPQGYLAARWQTGRMRVAEIDACWEASHTSQLFFSAESGRE